MKKKWTSLPDRDLRNLSGWGAQKTVGVSGVFARTRDGHDDPRWKRPLTFRRTGAPEPSRRPTVLKNPKSREFRTVDILIHIMRLSCCFVPIYTLSWLKKRFNGQKCEIDDELTWSESTEAMLTERKGICSHLFWFTSPIMPCFCGRAKARFSLNVSFR